MMRTDIFRRGVPWMLLIKRSGTIESDLNVKSGQKACVALTGLSLLAAPLSALIPWAGLGVPIGLAAIVALNRGFFAFLVRRKGVAFACAALPLHLLYYSCCGFSVLIAQVYWQLRNRGNDSIRLGAQERTDPGVGSIPQPAGARRARRPSRWRARSR